MAPPGVLSGLSLTAEPQIVWYNLVNGELHGNSDTDSLTEIASFHVLTIILM
jgi:hypothetical protein